MIGDATIHPTLLELMRMYEIAEERTEIEARAGVFISTPKFSITHVGDQLKRFVEHHYTDQQRFALKLQYPLLQRVLK